MKLAHIAATAALFSISLYAQTTAGLMPPPKFQALTNAGLPCSGCQLFTYAAGTSTPQPSYTDSTGGVANANPVILDAFGRASVWLGSSAYKIALEDALGNVMWTVDNVTAPTLGSASVTVPTGSTLTLASGSITSISTDLLPGTPNTYNVGASGNAFLTGYINALVTNGTITTATDNTYDWGAAGAAARKIFASTSLYAPNVKICATGNADVNCWYWAQQATSNIRLYDNAANIPIQIQYLGTNNYEFGVRGSLYPLDRTAPDGDLGYSSTPWNNAYLAAALNFTTAGAHINAKNSGTNDASGFIAITAATAGGYTFFTPYNSAPVCVATPTSNPGTTVWWVSTTTTTVTVNLSASSTLTFDYVCTGNPN